MNTNHADGNYFDWHISENKLAIKGSFHVIELLMHANTVYSVIHSSVLLKRSGGWTFQDSSLGVINLILNDYSFTSS